MNRLSGMPGEAPDDDSWMMTYLDMMTLLLVVTMAMLAMTGKLQAAKPSAAIPMPFLVQGMLPHGLALLGRPLPPPPVAVPPAAPVEPAPPTTAELLKGMGLDALGKDIEVVNNRGALSFRLSSEFLFGSAQSDLSPEGVAALQQLVAVLGRNDHQVLVEGHTDSEQMHSLRYPSNWELSSARAANVVRYLQNNGVQGERLQAIGYGDTRPLADNGSPDGRARNRRVEIVLQSEPG
ncbi:MAG: OmpA family protein [Pseudomonas sp.]|uniref:OmpA/MotB family protein n=1 Tax=Pseudomonas abieticivorans TaxID=2931382 RepID=UPI0020BD6C02|nr:OmpA family protein [Pseudomonas sp. PIA16]MDE1168428.1 OmpA family protein [Pseudomonas sp.]